MFAQVPAPSLSIPIKPITGFLFSDFGEVIENPATHHDCLPFTTMEANQGSATKVLDVTHMQSHYQRCPSQKPAHPIMNMFICKPRDLSQRNGKSVFPVKILERHPFTPQTFVPMGLDSNDPETYYLVIVAPTLPMAGSTSSETGVDTPSSVKRKGAGLPDLDKVQAFLARGDQAVTYGPGTWHAPMVAIGKRPVEFVVMQFANGVADEDCQETEVLSRPDEEGLAVVIDKVSPSTSMGKARL